MDRVRGGSRRPRGRSRAGLLLRHGGHRGSAVPAAREGRRHRRSDARVQQHRPARWSPSRGPGGPSYGGSTSATRRLWSRPWTGADVLWAESPTNPMLEVADLPRIFEAAHTVGAACSSRQHLCHPTGPAAVVDGRRRGGPLGHEVPRRALGCASGRHGHRRHRRRPPAPRAARRAPAAPRRHRGPDGDLACPARHADDAPAGRALQCQRSSSWPPGCSGHPAVERLRYPGFGSVIAIEVLGGPQAAETVAASVRLWTHATSLGGVESPARAPPPASVRAIDRPGQPAYALVGRRRGRRRPVARSERGPGPPDDPTHSRGQTRPEVLAAAGSPAGGVRRSRPCGRGTSTCRPRGQACGPRAPLRATFSMIGTSTPWRRASSRMD